MNMGIVFLHTLFYLTVVKSVNSNCDCGWSNKLKIVNGRETVENEYPWMVSIVMYNQTSKGWDHQCGGSIITEFHVLTAAHCVVLLQGYILGFIVGLHNYDEVYSGKKNVMPIDKIIAHKAFSMQTRNDIALLVSKRRIPFSLMVGPACLPHRRLNMENKKVTAMGWGRTYFYGPLSQVLLEVNLTVLSSAECKNMWPRSHKQLCTYEKGKDTCQGDSGGPLVWLDADTGRYTQIGLVSAGNICADRFGAINTDVSSYLSWISRRVRETSRKARLCTGRGSLYL